MKQREESASRDVELSLSETGPVTDQIENRKGIIYCKSQHPCSMPHFMIENRKYLHGCLLAEAGYLSS